MLLRGDRLQLEYFRPTFAQFLKILCKSISSLANPDLVAESKVRRNAKFQTVSIL
jgi:hypothetical protein